ncbi:MAG: hypothetical protein RR646_02315 [Erysipelotrichaceae bacterium]
MKYRIYLIKDEYKVMFNEHPQVFYKLMLLNNLQSFKMVNHYTVSELFNGISYFYDRDDLLVVSSIIIIENTLTRVTYTLEVFNNYLEVNIVEHNPFLEYIERVSPKFLIFDEMEHLLL